MRTTTKTSGEPLMLKLRDAPTMLGMSRSSIYRAAAAGRIKLVKNGRITLIEMKSARQYLDSLPTLTPKSAA